MFKGDFSFLSELIKKHNVTFEDLQQSEKELIKVQAHDKPYKKTGYEALIHFLKTISGYKFFFGG